MRRFIVSSGLAFIFTILILATASRLFGYGASTCETPLTADPIYGSCMNADESSTGGCANVGNSTACDSAFGDSCNGSEGKNNKQCIPVESTQPSICKGNGQMQKCGTRFKQNCTWDAVQGCVVDRSMPPTTDGLSCKTIKCN